MSSIIDGINVIIARLSQISTANGYSIDLNSNVQVDEESIDVDSLPVAMLFTGEATESSRGGHHITWSRVMQVDVMKKVDPLDGADWVQSENLMNDIHTALIAPELNKACTNRHLNLDGTVKDFKISTATFSVREDGHRVKGVSCEITLEYITNYAAHSN